MPDNGVITLAQRSSAPSSPTVGSMSLYVSGSSLLTITPSGSIVVVGTGGDTTPPALKVYTNTSFT